MLAALLGWPALATVLAAWSQSPGPAGGGLIAPPAAGSDAAHLPRPLKLAATSLRVVLGTEAIALPLGVPLAFLLFRSDLRGRRVGIALAALMAFVPLPLVATAWLGALANAGRSQALGFGPILSGVWGAAFLQAMAGLPWVVLVAGVGLCAVEPELEEAALLDLPGWRVVMQIALRRSAAALAGAALVLAVITAGDMTVTDLLQVRTYAEEAYVQYQLGHGLEAAAAVTLLPLLMLGTLIALVTRNLLAVERERLAAALARARLWRLGRWHIGVWLLVAAAAGSVVFLPLYSLVWWAGRVGGKAIVGHGPTWSLPGLVGTLRAAVWDAAGPLGTSLLWSSLGATATVALAWALAWVSRTPGLWRYAVAGCAALTLATPGPVLGMALVVAYIRFPLIYNSPLLIVLADILRTLPFCLLVLWPAVRAIPAAWLEAAAVDGYGPSGQIARVAIPATRDAALAGWLVAFALGLGELPATNLVAPPGTTPLTVLIWGLLHTGVESQLAGVALVQLGAVAVPGALAAWALGRLARRGGLPRA
jgi:iron(III) transport system permease protein